MEGMMRSKLLVFTVFCAGLTASVAGCSSETSAPSTALRAGTDDDAVALLPDGTESVTFATDATYVPFETVDADGTIVGVDPDLVAALGRALGVKTELINVGFDSIIPGLQAGKYDAAASAMSVTADRAQVVDFVEYAQAGSGLIVEAGNPSGLAMEPARLCGHTIGAPRGTIQAIEQLPQISALCEEDGRPPVAIAQFPNQDAVNLAVLSGRADAGMAASISLALQADGSGGALELAPGSDYSPRAIGIAFPKGSPLVPAVQEAVNGMVERGDLEQMVTGWGLPASAVIGD
jgi:polar amino acid transport system substrate-binding protein